MGPMPTASAAAAFWSSLDASLWRRFLNLHDIALREKADGLSESEEYLWGDLVTTINRRKPPHMTAEEYRKVIDWKLTRGKFRPSLKGYAKGVSDQEMIRASKEALANLNSKGEVKNVIEPLLEIKGCGPATASAIVAVMDPSWPFMSDELLQLATEEKKYTKNMYLKLVDLAREKARVLTKGENKNKGMSKKVKNGRSWTARDVERAAFAFMRGTEGGEKQKNEDEDEEENEAVTANVVKQGGEVEEEELEEKKKKNTKSRSKRKRAVMKTDGGDGPADVTPAKEGERRRSKRGKS